ncbi:MAG: hypothetical protein Q4C43_02255 [Prevotella sp.]|nr:hypothetical protein [Prevotella sp.]
MKKFFISLVVSLMGTTMAFAQSSMLATLNHDGTISTFYGSTALREAHAAAENGDVITLSSGTFVSTDITKAITLRGAGMGIDAATQSEPTIISGPINICINDTVTKRLTIEGIYNNDKLYYIGATLKNAMFLKCRFKEITDFSSGKLKDASFIHCRIADRFSLAKDCSATCINCAIEDPYSSDMETSNFEFINCVLRVDCRDIKSSSLKNCIIYDTKSLYTPYFPSSTTAYNCIGLNGSQIFKNITNSTNSLAEVSEVFKTYTGQSLNQLDNETFELTDTAKEKYHSMDGTTEVGIHGGSLPFDATPSNPQITKCNVAAKSTADGKLSVDIQVNSAQ